jgi:hypothetical protein
MGMGGQRYAPAALSPGKTRYPLYRKLGGPQGRSGQVRKISPPPGFDPRNVQPVESRYTDCGIPTQANSIIFKKKTIKKYCNEHSKAENVTPASTYVNTLHIGSSTWCTPELQVVTTAL